MMVADPHNRNGHAELVGKHLPPKQFASDVAGTARLLSWASAMIDYRHGTGRFTTPTSTEPGVLLLLEDSHTIFSDPALAELGERIATAGPPVCVAIVATTEMITRDAFSGHGRLVVALAEHGGVEPVGELAEQWCRVTAQCGRARCRYLAAWG